MASKAKPMDAHWEPVKPSTLDRLQDCAKSVSLYEEPTQDVEDDRKRLQDLVREWDTCHFGGGNVV